MFSIFLNRAPYTGDAPTLYRLAYKSRRQRGGVCLVYSVVLEVRDVFQNSEYASVYVCVCTCVDRMNHSFA